MPSSTTPERMCTVCRRKDKQGSFFRFARSSEESVVRWNGIGRSAYCCRTEACLAAAFVKGRLERALRGKINADSKANLQKEIECELR